LLVTSADGIFDEGKDALNRAKTTGQEKVVHDATFTDLVHRHSDLMYRIAFSLLRNAHDSEDAVQEVFLKLYRGAGWSRMKDEKAFLARSVWRAALDRLPSASQLPLDGTNEQFAEKGDSPETTVVREELANHLRKLISALPGTLRQPLLLSAIEGLNSREVGLLLEIPEGTVRTRLKLAREELRKRFGSAKRSVK
jgi:RNA polymerase sigma-70 factor, ECF subfamily